MKGHHTLTHSHTHSHWHWRCITAVSCCNHAEKPCVHCPPLHTCTGNCKAHTHTQTDTHKQIHTHTHTHLHTHTHTQGRERNNFPSRLASLIESGLSLTSPPLLLLSELFYTFCLHYTVSLSHTHTHTHGTGDA